MVVYKQIMMLLIKTYRYLTAGDINTNFIQVIPQDEESMPEVTVVNPEQVIATLAPGAKVTMTLRIKKGVGYVGADEKKYVDVSIEQEFSTNSVCLLITHSASMQVKDYTPRDFIEVSPDQVIDDDPYTYEYIVKYLKGEQIDTNKINIDQFRRGL